MTATLSEYVFVHAGPNYGRRHRVLARTEYPVRTVTVIHEATGTVVTVPACDVEEIRAEKEVAA